MLGREHFTFKHGGTTSSMVSWRVLVVNNIPLMSVDEGPVLRQGPNKLVFNSVAAVRGRPSPVQAAAGVYPLTRDYLDIYLNDNVSKSTAYQAGNVNPRATNVFNSINKQVHRAKRRLVGPAVTDHSMRAFEPVMLNQVHIFLKELLSTSQSTLSDTINLSDRCKYLSLDISALLSFGYPLNLQTDEENRFVIPAMTGGSWRINIYMQFPILRKLQYEIFAYARTLITGKGYLLTLIKMIKSRQAKDKHAIHDLYSFMTGAEDAPDKNKIEMSEVWTEAIFFVSAAGDTISTALSAVFFYLAQNPRCKSQLADEIRSAFTTGDQIHAGPQLSGCRYLRACIDEALRMSPPVPGTLWRERLAQDGDEPWVVDGHVVPPGVRVGVNAYALHHNEEYFPEPFVYRPERWLKSPSEVDSDARPSHANSSSNSARAAFIPFTLGARACAGKAMAYHEVGLVIAKTIWYFDFQPSDANERVCVNDNGEFLLEDVFTSVHSGPYLTFKTRGDFWKELVSQEGDAAAPGL